MDAKKIEKPGSVPVIKFNMAEDDVIRNISKKGHEIAKMLRTAGLVFKRVTPAISDLSIKKQFRLGNNAVHICIEIPYSEDALKDETNINEMRAFLLGLTDYRMVSDQKYNYQVGDSVHRFLLLGEISVPVMAKKPQQEEAE